jgi:site-specific recombinase XerC
LLAVSPDGKLNIHSDQIDDFIAHLRDERGLSPRTVSHRRWQVERFPAARLRRQSVDRGHRRRALPGKSS